MDNIEKYIKGNTESWDNLKAPPMAWGKIEAELNKEEDSKNKFSRWGKLLLLLSGIILLAIITIPQIINSKSQESTPSEILQFAEVPDYQETEHFYKTNIDLSLVALQKLDPDATLLNDLSQLDEIEKELRAEYAASQGAYKENILHALIRNHKIKLELLEIVLEELQKTQIEQDEII